VPDFCSSGHIGLVVGVREPESTILEFIVLHKEHPGPCMYKECRCGSREVGPFATLAPHRAKSLLATCQGWTWPRRTNDLEERPPTRAESATVGQMSGHVFVGAEVGTCAARNIVLVNGLSIAEVPRTNRRASDRQMVIVLSNIHKQRINN